MSAAEQTERDEPQDAASRNGEPQGAVRSNGESRGAASQDDGAQGAAGRKGESQSASPAAALPGMVDLNGGFRFKVDGKGRVSLPAKFRRALSKDLVVTLNLKDECLYVFETPDFNDWVARLLRENFGPYKASDNRQAGFRRKLKSRARDIEVDASGRIMLPAELRKAAGIDKDVMLVGNTGYFEIWDAKRYDEVSDIYDLSTLSVG